MLDRSGAKPKRRSLRVCNGADIRAALEISGTR